MIHHVGVIKGGPSVDLDDTLTPRLTCKDPQQGCLSHAIRTDKTMDSRRGEVEGNAA